MRQSPTSELKKRYKLEIEKGLIISLSLCIILLQLFKRSDVQKKIQETQLTMFEVTEIPVTEQQKSAPPPPRMSVPIPSEDEDLPEDETIDFTDFDLDDEPPPPPPPPDDDEQIVFVPYDEAPKPVGGFAAIQKKLKYPEIARKAGVEGRVTIWARIDEQGNVVSTKVQQSLGPNGCDEAAINAIKAVEWLPAKQRTRPVKVWIAVPVDFKLR